MGLAITVSLIGSLVVFVVLEITALLVGEETMSMFVIRKASEGSRLWKGFILLFPLVILGVSIWLLFHWFAFCINFGLFCGVDV